MADNQHRTTLTGITDQPRTNEEKTDFRLTVLGEDNYITWKWQISMILKSKGLFECVEGKCDDASKNEQAATFLASALSQQNMQRVINCSTAVEIWTALESTFENKSSSQRTMLMEKFTSYRIRSVRDISKSISEIQALAAKLRSLGATIDDEFVISIILKGLPEALKNWKSTWKMVNAEKPNLNNLITGLMAEIIDMKTPESSAYLAKNKPGKNGKYYGNKNQDRSQIKCYYCNKLGHIARDCRKKEADAKQEKSAPEHAGHANMGVANSADRDTDDEPTGIAMMALTYEHNLNPDCVDEIRFVVRRQLLRLLRSFMYTVKMEKYENFEYDENDGYDDGSSLPKKQRKTRRGRCFYCKEFGHHREECEERKRNKEMIGGTWSDPLSRRSHLLLMAAEPWDHMGSGIWIADSGSSFHMTPNREWIREYRDFGQPKSISLGDNHCIPAYGCGKVRTSFGEMKNVHYVPELSANLFSISAATSMGVEARCTHDGICLTKDDRTVLSGKRTQGVYALKFGIEADEGKAFYAASLNEWHERLGHVSKKAIRRMVECKAVDGLNIKDINEEHKQCLDCEVSKCKHASHPGKTTAKQDKPGTSLHIDTVGPFKQESLGGSKYLVLCKDEASSYVLGKTVASKSEIPDQVKLLLSKAELETRNKVLRIHTDNGSEFRNENLRRHLLERGIAHHFSVPYTPQQNGRIERQVRTVVESARTLLAQSKLGGELWAEAVMTAIYVLNRVICCEDSERTPYEMWFNKKPSLRNIHNFGQPAVVKYRDYPNSKWDAKGVEQIFIGYTENFNTFRFYDKKSEQVYSSCDAIFLDKVDNNDSTEEYEEELVGGCSRGADEIVTNNNQHDESFETADLSWDMSDINVEEDNDTTAIFTGDATPAGRAPHDIHRKEGETSGLDGTRALVKVKTPPTTKKVKVTKEISKRMRLEHIKSPSTRAMPSDIHPKHIVSRRLRSPTRHHAKLAKLELEEDPKSYTAAMSRPDKAEWLAAMEEEMESLRKNHVYEVVDRPKGNIVTNKWVLKIKKNSEGKVERYKARLVARGFSQAYGIDYLETYAPVANMVSIRMLFAYAAMKKLEMVQFDIKTAFLYGELDEIVYMEQPEGYIEDKDKVWLLKRSLYGLKQSPRQWNIKFSNFLRDMNLKVSEHDSCIYYKKDPMLIIAIYVDDGMIFAKDKNDIMKVILELKSKFEVHVMESVSSFLGFQVYRGMSGEIALHQTNYIETILKRFNMEDSKTVDSPIALTSTTTDEQPLDKNIPYREAIGSLMYAAVITRVDIAYAVGKASRHVENPTNQDWAAVKRIFRYLKGRENLSLVYRNVKDQELVVYCDADFAGDPKTSRSTTGSVFIFGGAPVQWKSQRQSLVTTSSTEAEFVSLCSTAKETIWIRKLARELNLIREEPTMIYCDNQSALRIATDEKCMQRTRHMSVQASYPREQMEKGEITISHIKSDDQLADMLTKPTTNIKFLRNTSRIMSTLINLLCTALFIIMCAGPSYGQDYAFEKINPLILLPEENFVEERTILYEIELTHQNPCEKYLTPKAPLTFATLSDDEDTMLKNLKASCQKTYQKEFLDKIENLAQNQTEKPQVIDKGLSRKRREPFTLTIGAVAALVVGVVVVYDTLSSFVGNAVPWGDGYRIKKLSEQRAIDMQRFRDLEERFNRLDNEQRAISGRIDGIDKTVLSHTIRLNNLNEAIPRLIWLGAYLSNQINIAGERVDRMIRNYRYGKAAPEELVSLFNLTEFKNVKSEDTFILTTFKKSENTLAMKIAVKTKSEDTHIYRTFAFNFWNDIATKPVFTRWTGPDYYIYNKTSRCAKRIEKPRYRGIQDTCVEIDQSDGKLASWSSTPSNYTVRREDITVFSGFKNNYIYCFGFKILFDDMNHTCPTFPFKLPLEIGYELDGHRHHSTIVKVRGQGLNFDIIDNLLPSKILPTMRISDSSLYQSLNHMKENQKEEMENRLWFIVAAVMATAVVCATIVLIIVQFHQYKLAKRKHKRQEYTRMRKRTLMNAAKHAIQHESEHLYNTDDMGSTTGQSMDTEETNPKQELPRSTKHK